MQGHATTVTLFLNRTYADESWRNLVTQQKFRQALLLGVDQESLAELLAPGRKDHFVSPSLGHDPAAAQVLLNELGLNQVERERVAVGSRMGLSLTACQLNMIRT